ncbi:XrtY-associated glycosyltransferase XYAG1 [Pedobacter sp. PWIIR3]
MKILQIVPSYKPAYIYGGPIESVAKLCEGLILHGQQVDVFTTTANGETELEIEAGVPIDVDGVTVRYFKRVSKDPTHASPALWKFLYSNVNSYDIIHIQSWWSILVLVSAFICLIKGKKVVVSPRGMLSIYIFNSGQSKIKKIIHKAFGRNLLAQTNLHATAKSEFEECRHVIKDWKGFILPNIISLPKLEIIKKPNEVFTLVFMSRIHPKKGIELLLNAVACLPFEFRLQIAGSGEDSYIKELKQLAADLDISHQLEWLGWVDRDQKFKLLMNADLFALVSYNENFANVVIESLHVGTPVLLSYGVALSEFVQQRDLGWVTSLEIEAVAAKILDIESDKLKRTRINSTSNLIVGDIFAPEKLIPKYIHEYENIINDK